MNRRATSRGFTLIELMVVVAIIGILAALAVYGLMKYVLAAGSAEAIEIINGVRGAQESYKDETFKYLEVGSKDVYFPFDSKLDMRNATRSWTGGDAELLKKWDQLGVRPSTSVKFGYACMTDESGDLPSALDLGLQEGNPLPAEATGTWYVVRATGDRDGTAKTVSDYEAFAVFVGSSFSDRIYAERDSE